MAYITTEEVKEIRKELNKKFNKKNGWKLSVAREHYSCVNVFIIEAPIELRNDVNRTYEQVNNFSIVDRENVESREPLEEINKIVNKNNFDESDSMTDYFNVGFYFHLRIGKYDKPFKVNN